MDIVRGIKLLILSCMVIAVIFTLTIQLPKTYTAHLSYQEYKEWVKQEVARNRALIEAYRRLPPMDYPGQQISVQQKRPEQKLEKIRQQMIRETEAQLAAEVAKKARLEAELAKHHERGRAMERRFAETQARMGPRFKSNPMYSGERSRETYRCTTAAGATVYQEIPCAISP